MRRKNSSYNCGFTLTELAIVLAVMSVVFAAIWTASASAVTSHRLNLTVQQVAQVVNDARQYYLNAQGIPGSCNNNNIIPTFDAAGVLPAELKSTCAACPGGVKFDTNFANTATGSFQMRGSASGSCPNGAASKFRIILTNLPADICVRLLFSGINYQDFSLGVKSVCASQVAQCTGGVPGQWRDVTCANGICGPNGSVPITLVQAIQNWCTGVTNELGWEFSLGINNP